MSSLALAACGGGGERQDEGKPEGDFPVTITEAQFPEKQRLAQTSDLRLDVLNSGSETVPDLAVTISTDPNADESFSVHIERPDVAITSRPVWVLENEYPKLVGETAPAGAFAAETKTFSFGPLEPGETRRMVWRLVPVVAGEYTVTYTIAASLEGKAKATAGGGVPEGEFNVKISDVPPQTRVDDSGKVVPIEEGDIIGQAGSEEQKSEVGGDSGGGGK